MREGLFAIGLADIVFIPLIFALAFVRINYLVNTYKLHSSRREITNLFYYHMLFGMIYMLYVTFLGGDAIGYWTAGLQQVNIIDANWLDYYGTNTTFIVFFTFPFSQILGLNFLSGSILFSFFGFIGFTYIYLIMKPYGRYMVVNGISLFPAILFLPNIHFWSSGVGKDSLIFMAIAILVYTSKKVSKSLFLAVLAFALIYHIRPHMAILLGGSYVIASFLGGNLSIGQRIVGLSVGIIGLVLVFPTVLEFLQLEEFSTEALRNKAEGQAAVLSRSTVGSAVDISSYSIPLKVFTYLFRPLFFDAHNFFALIVSFENLIYLIVFLLMLNRRTLSVFQKSPSHIKMALVTFIGATIIFSISLGNLGIALRMKNMTMIYMLMFSLIVVAHGNYSRFKANQKRNVSR